MSIQAVGWALDQELPARPKLVLVSIANHANATDGYCWLKAETIGAEASCSKRAVWNFIGALIRNGYIRKAPRRREDGRQRANDYWIVFDRPAAEWVSVNDAHEEEFVEAEDLSEGEDVEPQDVVEPSANGAPQNSGESQALETTQLPARAPGPSAPVCTHKDSAEPSESKPKKDSSRARGQPPRAYRPPPPEPPQPVGAVSGAKGELIFVFEGTPAYDAWQRAKSRELGRPWHMWTSKDGRWGWYFPTLFPPGEATREDEIEPIDPPFSRAG